MDFSYVPTCSNAESNSYNAEIFFSFSLIGTEGDVVLKLFAFGLATVTGCFFENADWLYLFWEGDGTACFVVYWVGLVFGSTTLIFGSSSDYRISFISNVADPDMGPSPEVVW